MLSPIWVKEHRPWHRRWKMGGGREQNVEWGSSSHELCHGWQLLSPPPAITSLPTLAFAAFLKPTGASKPNFSGFPTAQDNKAAPEAGLSSTVLFPHSSLAPRPPCTPAQTTPQFSQEATDRKGFKYMSTVWKQNETNF